MDKFRFWKMVSYSIDIITKPFKSTLELKDEGGLSHALKYIFIVTLTKIIFPILMILILVIFIKAIMGSISGYIGPGEGILLITLLAAIVGALLLIAIIIVEPIKILVFTFVFQRLSGLQGSTAAFRELVYSFALFWAPWILFEGLLSIILGHTIPDGDINNTVQWINVILVLVVKGVIMYFYFSRIGMAITKLPLRKIAFPTVSSIVVLLLLEKAIFFLISSRIISAINQVMFG